MITNISEIPLYTTGIYKINYDNQKIYIGQALNIRTRALEHNSKKQYPCDKALKQHDANLEILEQCDVNDLDECEQKWIIYYDATNKSKGYNILLGGNASGKSGVENINASLNNQQLDEVIDLLINHCELSYIDIAKKYNIEQNTVLAISKGKRYFNPELKYPLRCNNHQSQLKNDLYDYFSEEKDLLKLKYDLKYRWDLSIETDLIEKYKIPLKILRDINNGRKFSEYGDYTYPIRGKNVRNKNNFSINDINSILNDLRNTSMTKIAIGEKYGINRSTVDNINRGKTYIIDKYDYPARK